MPLIEDITEFEAGPSRPRGESLSTVLRQLAAKLALPEDLLTSLVNDDLRKSESRVIRLIISSACQDI
jgi:hypothetical protein